MYQRADGGGKHILSVRGEVGWTGESTPIFERFYAGAPLWLPNGYPVGTVCLVSPLPRERFDGGDRRLLASLATMAMNAIAVRALRRGLDKSKADSGGYWMILETLPVPVALAGEDGRIGECNEAFASLCVVASPEGLTVNEALPTVAGGWTPEFTAGGDRAVFTIALPSGIIGTTACMAKR